MLDKILILQHRGGEYAAVNLSGLGEAFSRGLPVLDRAARLLARPSVTGNAALQLLDTSLGKEEAEQVAAWVREREGAVRRLALIGAGRRERRRLKGCFRSAPPGCVWEFFSDWEAAKDWLTLGG